MKDDTETAIIAFRHRVAEVCKAEVTTEDAVKGDKQSNGLIENTVMLICGIIRTRHMSHWHQHTRTTQGRHANSCLVGRTCRMHPVQGLNKVETGKHHSRDCMARKRHTTLSHLIRKYWRRKSPRIPRSARIRCSCSGFGSDCETKFQCFVVNADDVFRAREIRRLEPQNRWDKDTINSIIWSASESGKRQMDSGQAGNWSGPNSNLTMAI